MMLQHPLSGMLVRAVIEHFGTEDLQLILRERLGVRYNRATNHNLRWSTQALEVVEYFNQRNTVDGLVVALRDARPEVGVFAVVADGLGFATIPTSGLQVLVHDSGTPYHDVVAFRGGLAKIEAAVCQIAAGGASDTGTLVARGAVLTNHHVIAGLLDAAGAMTGSATCRFNFKTNGGYTTPAQTVAARVLLASSPHAVEDPRVGPMATDPARLDYALLRLDRAIGDEPLVNGGTPRGWVDIGAAATIGRNAGALVMQHPGGKPMKIDLGAVLDDGPIRFPHSVNTEPGSSGAPVLNAGLHWSAFTMPVPEGAWKPADLQRGSAARADPGGRARQGCGGLTCRRPDPSGLPCWRCYARSMRRTYASS